MTKLLDNKNVLEAQESYGPPVSQCQVWLGLECACCSGVEWFSVCLFSVTLMISRVCDSHFTAKALEQFSYHSIENVCSCESTFNFVCSLSDGKNTECVS